jgi:hypothetical protein
VLPADNSAKSAPGENLTLLAVALGLPVGLCAKALLHTVGKTSAFMVVVSIGPAQAAETIRTARAMAPTAAFSSRQTGPTLPAVVTKRRFGENALDTFWLERRHRKRRRRYYTPAKTKFGVMDDAKVIRDSVAEMFPASGHGARPPQAIL